MEQKYSSRGSWLRTAVHEIRFAPDREAVRQELQEHIEDKVADLLRIFPGMTLQEAEERAMAQMGDPEEIGKELAKIHKPWWGYLWKVSRVAAALVGAVTVFYCLGWGLDAIGEWNEAKEQTPGMYECYLQGVDPYAPGGPRWEEDNEWAEQTVRKPLKVFSPEDTAKAGNFTFSMPKAALWSFTDENGEETWQLYCKLRVKGLPWENFSDWAAIHIYAEDSRGERFFSEYEVHYLDKGSFSDFDYVAVDPVSEPSSGGWIITIPPAEVYNEHNYYLMLFEMEPGAEWIEFAFDRGGETWSLTVPLMEGEA